MIKLKKTYIAMMMAAVLTACGHRATSGSSSEDAAAVDSTASGDIQDVTLQTDSVGMEREDSMASVRATADWPVKGNEALVKSIRQYICEEMASDPFGEGKPEVKLFEDGQKVVEATVNRQYQKLSEEWKEMRKEGYEGDMSFGSDVHVSKLVETDLYITYMSNAEGFMGGAHGYAIATGQTFRKSDGKRIGYTTEYDQATETFHQKDQTLFSDPQSPKLFALIKEGVRSYFAEFETDVKTDEALKDMLIGVEDINRIPLPSAAPYFTKEGLSFVYQQYEIAPYAAGMVSFNISYAKIRPFLTKDASALVNDN